VFAIAPALESLACEAVCTVRMDTLTSIKVFRQVVESGSFVQASEQLNISTAMVSKHVTQVEKRLGVRLLNRSSRTLSLTEAGKVYFERSKTILDDLEHTELELASLNVVPRGTLRITCPSWFAGQPLAGLLAEYHRRYPEILVDVSFEDRIVDLVEEGYDLALRFAGSADSLPAGVIARAVRPMAFYLAASREYLERNGAPQAAEDLSRHDFVAVGHVNSLTLRGPAGALEVPVRAVLRCRSISGVVNAVAAGIGIAPLPQTYFEDPQYESILTPLLPDIPLWEATLYIVYASRKHVPLKLRTFIDFAIESIPRAPVPKAVAAGNR
jgi:DNA-binding transcriptional LysR family regulator